jgi:hypothetical protein
MDNYLILADCWFFRKHAKCPNVQLISVLNGFPLHGVCLDYRLFFLFYYLQPRYYIVMGQFSLVNETDLPVRGIKCP